MSNYNSLSPVNHFRITLADGTAIECTSSLQDTLAFEREQKRPLVANGQTMPLTTDLLWLAWHAACRASKTDLRQFAQFLARVEEFEARAKTRDDYEYDADDIIDGATEIAEVIGANPTNDDQFRG